MGVIILAGATGWAPMPGGVATDTLVCQTTIIDVMTSIRVPAVFLASRHQKERDHAPTARRRRRLLP
jgi:hypothetical protein